MKSREQLKNRIAVSFAELPSNVAEEIAFHMTDWKENLDDMVRLYSSPEQLTNDEIQHMIIVFLAHVPNHIAAAKKLVGLGPIEDIFNVGVLTED